MERFIHESLAVRKPEKFLPTPAGFGTGRFFNRVWDDKIKPNDLSKNALYYQLLDLLNAQSFYEI